MTTVPRITKLPNRGWMTLRWMPIRPSPAATATGLWETTQILSGKRSISMGKPAAPPFMARTPRNLLADRLRHLEAHGIVTRQELPPPAARTVYELTGPGRELLPVIGALAQWGLTHLPPPGPDEPVSPSLGVLAERHGLPLPAAVRRPSSPARKGGRP